MREPVRKTENGVAGRMKRTPRKHGRLTLDQAMIAVLIAAMDANQHVSPEEAARAHHIIWSMRRFRRKSGEKVDRLIEIVRNRIDEDDMSAVLRQAARTIPSRLRPSAFAVGVDLMLADTKLEHEERKFVRRLATDLKIRAPLANDILRVMLIKNGA
jgi:tellurite resistance protein